jgi:ABC-type multidrug transport system fused ATPase/permease subunit
LYRNLRDNLLGDDARLAARTTWRLIRPHWPTAGLVFLANVGAAGFEGSTMALFAVAFQALFGGAQTSLAATLGPIGLLADRALGGLGRESMFLALILLAVGTVVVRSALQFGAAWALAFLQAEVFKDVWNRIFTQIMTMSYAQVSRYKAGDLNQYVWDANTMYQLLQQLNLLLGNVLIILVYLALARWHSWPMTLAALLALFLLSRSVSGVVRRIRASAESFLSARIEMGNRSLEFLSGLRLCYCAPTGIGPPRRSPG